MSHLRLWRGWWSQPAWVLVASPHWPPLPWLIPSSEPLVRHPPLNQEAKRFMFIQASQQSWDGGAVAHFTVKETEAQGVKLLL